MKAILALLLGVSFAKVDQNPFSALKMADAWKQEITYDWEALNRMSYTETSKHICIHIQYIDVEAFESWKIEFGKTYETMEEEAKHFITFLDNWYVCTLSEHTELVYMNTNIQENYQ